MESVALEPSRSQVEIKAPAKAIGRLLYIDNIRIFLTMLVIAHHLMVIYAGSGSWIYHEGRQDDITAALGGWFVSVNQAYFMGLFLFISAYFVPGAYDRKGPKKFLVDRLVRLGIPLAFYSWLLRPLLIYVGLEPGAPLGQWYTQEYFRVYGLIGGGPLWFIETLLLFSILYALGRSLIRPRFDQPAGEAAFPGNGTIALFALLLGVASFLIRILFPVNESFAPLNLQFANFAQYIALFAVGLVAYRKNWLAALPEKTGKVWLGVAIFLIFIYPPLGLLATALDSADLFLGGWHWQSLVLAWWESFLCLSACIGLIYFFRRYLDRQGPLARELSRDAYAAYLIHEPVITFAAAYTAGLLIYPLLKFVLASVVLIPACFGLGGLIRRLPYVDRVL